jgi:tetratricopeptide (TPR) repeat protein
MKHAIILLALVNACVPSVRRDPSPVVGRPEAVSMFGHRLYAPELPLERRTALEGELAAARRVYEAKPENADALLWYGRRTAYLGRYREAVEIFTEGAKRHPRDARMYRHRGHRYITLRQFDRAVRDLRRATELTAGRPDEIEPDGMPNARNVPLTTLHGNIWYHLGIAHYLKGEFRQASEAFGAALARARNDDARVSAGDWLYMSLRRSGRPAEAQQVLAAIPAGVQVIENGAYRRRLQLYRGEAAADSLLAEMGGDAVQLATLGYGVGNWHLYNGRRAAAEEVFWRVVQAENWAPFGYIAAEVELRNIERRRR